MSSVDSQNPWPLYDPYKDCSQGICSIYCRQWCYVIFPPPPPSTPGDAGSSTDFSPLVIAIIGILASAFILVSYFTIISKYCWRRGQDDGSLELNENHDQATNEALQGTSGGLDESLIKSITLCNYKKGDGFVDGTDCSVCLSEFQENECLRLLPKCSHAFHVPCIDTWLKTNASCPLCRANIVSANVLPSQAPASGQENQSNTSVSTLEYQQRSNDTVIVVQDLQGSVHEEAVVSSVVGDDVPKSPIFQGLGHVQSVQPSENMIEIRQDPIQQMRRSVSLNFAACQNQLLIADVLDINEEEDADDHRQIRETEKYRSGIFNLVRSPLATKRSISTGRYMFNGCEKGQGVRRPSIAITGVCLL